MSGPHSARSPAFFLATPLGSAPARLEEEDERHALRVLRLAAGARLTGIDGRGGRWPLTVRAAGRTLELEPAGPVESVPAPGQEGSSCPWFELAVAWPRKNRVEEMLGRLTQLGAAGILPLRARQRGPEEVPEEAPVRLQRVLREACKQCERAWLPRLEGARTPQELARDRKNAILALLDPAGGLPLDTWLRSLRPGPASLGTAERPIVLVVGPEGGFTEEEHEALREAGAAAVWLGAHVMRVETAAEAAMAVAAGVHASRPPRS